MLRHCIMLSIVNCDYISPSIDNAQIHDRLYIARESRFKLSAKYMQAMKYFHLHNDIQEKI